MTKTGILYVLKSTLSVKMRAETGDEVFASTGAEAHHVSEADMDGQRLKLDEMLSAWMKAKTESLGGGTFADDEAADEVEDAGEAEADDEADEAEEDDVTPDEVRKMAKADLDKLIDEYELDVDKKMKLADKREAIVEALFDDADEDEDADDADAEESDAEEGEEGEEEDFVPYEEDELKGMKLAELQEIASEWEVEVTVKKGADIKAKKAATIAAILAFQEEQAEE